MRQSLRRAQSLIQRFLPASLDAPPTTHEKPKPLAETPPVFCRQATVAPSSRAVRTAGTPATPAPTTTMSKVCSSANSVMGSSSTQLASTSSWCRSPTMTRLAFSPASMAGEMAPMPMAPAATAPVPRNVLLLMLLIGLYFIVGGAGFTSTPLGLHEARRWQAVLGLGMYPGPLSSIVIRRVVVVQQKRIPIANATPANGERHVAPWQNGVRHDIGNTGGATCAAAPTLPQPSEGTWRSPATRGAGAHGSWWASACSGPGP